MSLKNDGNFQVFYREGWACLLVHPKEKGSRPVYIEDIIGRLNLLNVPQVRRQIIIDCLEKASGKPEKLIPWPDGEKLGPETEINIDETSMLAYLTVTPEHQGGEPLSIEMLAAKLSESGIVFGIQTEVLESIITKKVYNQPVAVAHGLPPIHEESARIEYLFETERGKPFKVLEYERVDLRELNFIQNRNEGEVLAQLMEPVRPKDGRDVYGTELAAVTGCEEALLKGGTGTEISADGRELRATVTGNVKLNDSIIIVEPLVTVEDVDYANGNMDFKGSVDIQGRIADGFRVKAEGDIQIGKSVSRVTINSGGDMILKAGISGNDEGIIKCAGDLYARYIENAEVYCRGNLFVEEAIMHSKIKTEKDIVLTGKRAEIFGGKIVAGGSIRCKKLGSMNEPYTELHLGLTMEAFNNQEALEKKISEGNRELDLIDSQIRQLKSALKKGESGDNPLEKLSAALTQLEEKSEKLNSQTSIDLRDLHELKREQKLNEESHLSVEERIFGHVNVQFGSLRWLSSSKGTSKTVLVVKQGKLLEKGQE